MAKVQITLDASKLRGLIENRTFKNKDGEDQTIQEIKIDLVELKEKKSIYKKDTLEVFKTHFACAVQNKEQRENKDSPIYVGEGFTTVWGDVLDTKPTEQKKDTEMKSIDCPF